MSKLYTFGDSFTEGVGCKPSDEYYKKYNNKDNLIWPEIVANHYNMELINRGIGGCSNEIIIDNILAEWNSIKSEDIVIIGKTYGNRFDIPHQKSKGKFMSVWGPSWFDNPKIQDWVGTDILKKYLILFRGDFNLYDTRHYRYLIFIKQQLEATKDVKTIFWDVTSNISNIETITSATNSKIIDGHFSYQGHSDFSKWIINKINSQKTTKIGWI
jgi:hypothetical protein